MAEMKSMLDRSMLQMSRMQDEMESMRRENLEARAQLEGSVNYLEARCGSLERSLKTVIKRGKWEYSACFYNAHWWTANGYDEDYAKMMEELLIRMKRQTLQLRHDEGPLGDYISFGGGQPFVCLLYDEVTRPHWVELADALQLTNFTEFDLDISDVHLPKLVLDMLTPALKMKKVKSLAMRRNRFDNARDGIDFAVELMSNSRGIMTAFKWTGNPISDMCDAKVLVEAIIGCTSLKDVFLNELCEEGESWCYNLICELLTRNQGIEYMQLGYNCMRTSDTRIPDFLSRNPPLKYLELWGNHLNDDDAALIAESLKHNTNMEILNLENNDITETTGWSGCSAHGHI